jgi:HEAT repeat protein
MNRVEYLQGRLDQKDVPRYIQFLKHTNPSIRKDAAIILGKMGYDAKKAIPVLLQTLNDEQWKVRREAAIAIGQIGPLLSDIEPVIEQALNGESIKLRANAAYFLGEIGNIEGVEFTLIKLLKDMDRRVRMEAAIALAGC